ncbi:MAG: helix-turn-helix domain-containing protein [Capsulimonadaceae bacterium]
MDLSTRDGRRQQGDRIKAAARDAGLSLDDLATQIGCSRALIYQYVSGASLVQTDRLQQIGAAVDKPLTWFFETDDQRPFPAAQETSTTDAQRIRERIVQLRELAAACASPPNWRAVSDTCQKLVPLLQHEGATAELADVLFQQGNALLRINDMNGARARLQEAGALFRELGAADRHLDCLQSLGSADMHLGHIEPAIRTFQLVSAGAAWRNRWQGALSIGAAREMQGDYTAAADAFVRTQDIIGENADPASTAVAYLYLDSNWANLELAWGDYTRALQTAERCVSAAQRLGDQDQYLEALLNQAAALLGMFDLKPALRSAETVIHLAELVRDHERWSLALASRSLCYSACHQPAEAVVDAKEAMGQSLRHGARRAEVLANRAIVTAYLEADDVVESRYHVDQALAGARADRLRLPEAQFLALHAAVLRAEGDWKTAVSAAQQALAAAEALGARQVLYDSHLALATAHRDGEAFEESSRHAAEALRIGAALPAGASVWIPAGISADLNRRAGRQVDAEREFKDALASLDAHRRSCIDATGADTIVEHPEAMAVWKNWIGYLKQSGRRPEAVAAVESAAWPIPARWLEEHNDGN